MKTLKHKKLQIYIQTQIKMARWEADCLAILTEWLIGVNSTERSQQYQLRMYVINKALYSYKFYYIITNSYVLLCILPTYIL